MTSWQPIETAPKHNDDHGPYFPMALLWNGVKVRAGYHDDDDLWYDLREYFADNDEKRVIDPQPTHWQPFPAPPPPKARDEERRG